MLQAVRTAVFAVALAGGHAEAQTPPAAPAPPMSPEKKDAKDAALDLTKHTDDTLNLWVHEGPITYGDTTIRIKDMPGHGRIFEIGGRPFKVTTAKTGFIPLPNPGRWIHKITSDGSEMCLELRIGKPEEAEEVARYFPLSQFVATMQTLSKLPDGKSHSATLTFANQPKPKKYSRRIILVFAPPGMDEQKEGEKSEPMASK